MPTWPIHLLMAKKIDKELQLGNNFIIGNLIPDVFNGYMISNLSYRASHALTHYNFFTNSTRKYKAKINIDAFLNDYKNKWNNPIIVGYLTHLLTDFYFNKYTHDKFLKKSSYCINNYEDKKIFSLKKQQDFSIYGNYLIQKIDFDITVSKDNNLLNQLNALKNVKINDNDVNKIIYAITEILNKKNDSTEYKIFTTEELDKLFEDCYKYIVKFLKEQKIINL